MTSGPTRRQPSGALLIIGATIIAGLAGYLVTWLVLRSAGPAAYALFAVFWAALYLLVGGLAGVQQEITRATRPIEKGSRSVPSRARNFGLVAAGIVALAVIASAPLWQGRVFENAGWALVPPLAVGAGSYVLVATLCGSLYGIAQWRSLAVLIAADGVLRVTLVGTALLLGADIVALAWMVALPFPLAIVLFWPVIRGGFVGRSELDVGYRTLSANIARTVLASVSTAVIVSGFPLLLGIVGTQVEAALLGELIFTITLCRAPLIVSVMSLQSLLLVRFRDNPAGARATLVAVFGALAVGTAVLAALGWLLGPPVLTWISGFTTRIDGLFIAVLVVSSGLIAGLCVSAAAVLAVGRHLIYLLGWAVAAIVTVVVMLLPIDFLLKVGIALIVGPLAGLVLHTGWLVGRSARGTD